MGPLTSSYCTLTAGRPPCFSLRTTSAVYHESSNPASTPATCRQVTPSRACFVRRTKVAALCWAAGFEAAGGERQERRQQAVAAGRGGSCSALAAPCAILCHSGCKATAPGCSEHQRRAAQSCLWPHLHSKAWFDLHRKCNRLIITRRDWRPPAALSSL